MNFFTHGLLSLDIDFGAPQDQAAFNDSQQDDEHRDNTFYNNENHGDPSWLLKFDDFWFATTDSTTNWWDSFLETIEVDQDLSCCRGESESETSENVPKTPSPLPEDEERDKTSLASTSRSLNGGGDNIPITCAAIATPTPCPSTSHRLDSFVDLTIEMKQRSECAPQRAKRRASQAFGDDVGTDSGVEQRKQPCSVKKQRRSWNNVSVRLEKVQIGMGNSQETVTWKSRQKKWCTGKRKTWNDEELRRCVLAGMSWLSVWVRPCADGFPIELRWEEDEHGYTGFDAMTRRSMHIGRESMAALMGAPGESVFIQ
ncbi:hypothetical protein TruAng_011879 [Truncatella angustata]|nr:hypothetical protein TruAng_011879 [Truncatella angustata]